MERAPAIGGPTARWSAAFNDNYNDFAVTNGVTYFYAVSATILGCEGINSVPVGATLCAPPPAPTAGNNGLVWAGMTVNLTASTVRARRTVGLGPTAWRRNQNPVIPNASPSNSGIFSVTTTTGACSSTPATTTVFRQSTAQLGHPVLAGNILLSWSAGAQISHQSQWPMEQCQRRDLSAHQPGIGGLRVLSPPITLICLWVFPSFCGVRSLV